MQEKGTAKPQQRLNKRASRALLRHIIHQVYSESVTEPERLNKHYEPFSSEVSFSCGFLPIKFGSSPQKFLVRFWIRLKFEDSFTLQVYGETTYERVEQILHLVNMTEDDVFIDLGSGIGNVVVHVAGASQAKISCGIEIADVPNRYAHVRGFFLPRRVEGIRLALKLFTFPLEEREIGKGSSFQRHGKLPNQGFLCNKKRQTNKDLLHP